MRSKHGRGVAYCVLIWLDVNVHYLAKESLMDGLDATKGWESVSSRDQNHDLSSNSEKSKSIILMRFSRSGASVSSLPVYLDRLECPAVISTRIH